MKPTSAVNSTAVALVIATMPAGACCEAQANSANGTAELIAPISASFGHSPGAIAARSRHRNGSRTSAPKARRSSARAMVPNSGAAMRWNMKDAPQIAARIPSSTGVSHACTGAAAPIATSAGTGALGVVAGGTARGSALGIVGILTRGRALSPGAPGAR
jgi:hypothetical protein